MIKRLLSALLSCSLLLPTVTLAASTAPDKKAIVAHYSDMAYAIYSDAATAAETLQQRVDALLSAPSAATLEAARDAWLAARVPYQQSEVFRFGNAIVDDWVILGGYAGVNQFLRIGAHAMVGGMTHISHDVPAYVIVSGSPAAVRSVNTVGLERRGFDADTVKEIRRAFKIIYKKGLSLQDAQAQLADMVAATPALDVMLQSIKGSAKGIHR